MLCVIIQMDLITAFVNLDILEMDGVVWVNVFKTNISLFLWNPR